MRQNGLEVFINKKQYNSEIKPKESENFTNAQFESELEKKCSPQIFNLVKNNRFVKDSLLMLFDYHKKTFNHIIEVGNIAAYIAANSDEKIIKEEGENLIAAALLHDYGKLGVEKDFLDKREKLTSDEKEVLKQHVDIGFEAVKNFNEMWGKILVGHHEFQKDAYPRKEPALIGNDMRAPDEKVRRLSRVLAMIDAYEAMIDDRPGNPAKSIKEVNTELLKQFPLASDQEVIFLLKQYFMGKNQEEKIDAVFH